MLRQLTLAKGWKQDRNLCSQEKSRLPGKCFLLRSLTYDKYWLVVQMLSVQHPQTENTSRLYCACFLTFSLHFSVLMHFQRLRDPLWALVIVILSVENTLCSKTHWKAQMKNFSHSPYWLWVSSDCESDGVVIQTHQVTSYCLQWNTTACYKLARVTVQKSTEV